MEKQENSLEQDDLAVIVGKNIMRLRRMCNMTQLELAEKLNYSDKSISKWEQGNGLPDARILVRLAELFQVTVDDLLHENAEREIVPKNTRFLRRLIILLCSVGLCWLVAVAAFVFAGIIRPGLDFLWLAYVYAVPASAVVTLVFSCIWRYRVVRVVSVSVLIWTVLACIYLTALAFEANIWLIFLLGIPLQVLALFFFVWWKGAHFFRE